MKNTSLLALCKEYDVGGGSCGEVIDQIRISCKRDHRFWMKRPWDAEMLFMAAVDVAAFLPQLYSRLKR